MDPDDPLVWTPIESIVRNVSRASAARTRRCWDASQPVLGTEKFWADQTLEYLHRRGVTALTTAPRVEITG